MQVKKHLDMLGYKAKDRVTGFKGTITSIGFDLYGCIQVVVTPPINEKGDLDKGVWFDIARVEITDTERVMSLPDFDFGPVAEGRKGPECKPLM